MKGRQKRSLSTLSDAEEMAAERVFVSLLDQLATKSETLADRINQRLNETEHLFRSKDRVPNG